MPKRSRLPPAAPQTHAPSAVRRAIAQRVADAHEALAPGAITAMIFGSTVLGIADEHSDIDMSIVFETLPAEDELLAACQRAGGGPWTWRNESADDASTAVGFDLDGIEVQIAYTERCILDADLDTVLVAHDPTTLNHKIAEGLLKAEALLDAPRLQQWRARVAQFQAHAPLRRAVADRAGEPGRPRRDAARSAAGRGLCNAVCARRRGAGARRRSRAADRSDGGA